MPTSNVFLEKNKKERVVYRVVGVGFCFSFKASVLYDEKGAEDAATARAKNLGGCLERYNSLRDKYETIYTPKGGMAILSEIDTNAPSLGISASNKNMPILRH